MDYNHCQFAGRLTRENETRYTPKGTAVLSGSLAVNRRYKQGEEWKEDVDFVDLKAFGGTAELLQNTTGKGSPLFLDCEMRVERWNDKDSGQPRSKVVFIVQNFKYLESQAQQAERNAKSGQGGGGGGGGSNYDRAQQQSRAAGNGGGGGGGYQQRGGGTPPSGGGFSGGYGGGGERDEDDDIPF